MTTDFCIEAVEEAVHRHGKPGIFNTDQGSQFTSAEFVGLIQGYGIRVSMDGKGRGEAAVLGRLVSTLDRLIEIQDAETKRRHPRATRQISDIKAKLIERIEHLKQR